MKTAMAVGLMAIALLGVGLPSAYALDGPTPPQLADPAAAGTYNEIQALSFEGATGGSFQLRITVPPATTPTATATIFYNNSASELDTTIEAVTGAGTVTVVGTGASQLAPFTITFSGAAGGVDVKSEVFNFSTMVNVDGTLVTPIISSIQQGATTTSDDVAPHGGYSSLTDYCLQCHQVHSGRSGNTNGEYALLAEVNVTDTCATCHGYLGESPVGAEDPGFPGQEGTASLRAVYTADPIHNIGYSSSRYEAGWSFGWSFGGPTAPSTRRAGAGVSTTYGGGFYCGTCHTPHGEFGQLINSKWVYSSAGTTSQTMRAWANDTAIYWNDPATPEHSYAVVYLWQASAGAPWQVCTATGGGGTCSPAQIDDTEGQLVSLYGYKLLSYVPNHQYPYKNGGAFSTGAGADNTWGTPDDPTSALPPGGMYADSSYVFGNLARDALYPRDELASRVMLGHLHVDAGTGTAISVTEYSAGDAGAPTAPAIITADIENQALPFKIRIDDEIMMVTARTLASTDPDGFRTYDLTVTRNTEDPKEPWTSPVPASGLTAHNINADVTLVPTLLVNDGPAPLGLKSGMRLPLHVKFAAGSGSNAEVAVLMKRTTISATQGLYTIGRGVDGSPQTESHVSGTNVLAQSGSSVATVKSWGTDIYDHDSALWCGTCHTYSVDAAFGGQWHSHPTGCTACHGNPADGSSADFPHSSTNEFMLQEFPDALCISCHTPGSLP
jgi:hypothetical protein